MGGEHQGLTAMAPGLRIEGAVLVLQPRLQKASKQPAAGSKWGCQLFSTVVNGKPGSEQNGTDGIRTFAPLRNRTVGIDGQISRRDV
jgi:hypothetical protein